MAQSNSSGRIGFFGWLGIAFIILKLCETISWSWWLVLLPIYGGFAIVVILLILLGIINAIINY